MVASPFGASREFRFRGVRRGSALRRRRRQLHEHARHLAFALSRFGVAARAIVFALLGWGIVVAGWFRDASEVGTTASSLRILAAQPGGTGRWLLGVTAAGFVAYGFYQIIHARYLHIRLKR